jgi:hypothetical protein
VSQNCMVHRYSNCPGQHHPQTEGFFLRLDILMWRTVVYKQ